MRTCTPPERCRGDLPLVSAVFLPRPESVKAVQALGFGEYGFELEIQGLGIQGLELGFGMYDFKFGI